MKILVIHRLLVVATLAALAPGRAPVVGATGTLPSAAVVTTTGTGTGFIGRDLGDEVAHRRVQVYAPTAVDGMGVYPTTLRGESKPAGSIDTQNRAAVRQAYNAVRSTLYQSAVTTADPSRCLAGNTSGTTQAAVLRSINFYRGLTGVPAVQLDPALSAKAQQAAMLMSANQQLSHRPPSNWRCWNQTGATAAGNSNLALGASGPEAIALYMSDPGQNNTEVGHRRWVLNPYVTRLGSGNTSNSNALWVFGPMNAAAPAPPFSGWPTAGYFPAGLEPGGRWSFSTTRADVSLSSARASVAPIGGHPLPVQTLPIALGYGLDTLVFEVGGLQQPTGAALAGYQVTIIGMKQRGVVVPPYRYVVRLTN